MYRGIKCTIRIRKVVEQISENKLIREDFNTIKSWGDLFKPIYRPFQTFYHQNSRIWTRRESNTNRVGFVLIGSLSCDYVFRDRIRYNYSVS